MSKQRKTNYHTKIRPRLLEIPEWRGKGLNLRDIAKKLDVSYSAFMDYRNKHEELDDILAIAKEALVGNIEASLYKKAIGGYKTYKERINYDADGNVNSRTVDIATAEADNTAIIFSLKSLVPERYVERQIIEFSDQVAQPSFRDILLQKTETKRINPHGVEVEVVKDE